MAISDVKNFNKIYKPKSEQMKNSWKEAVVSAQRLESMDTRERLRFCDLARLEDRGGKALIKKYESDHRQEERRRSNSHHLPADPDAAATRSPSVSPAVSPKKNSSPGSAELHTKKMGNSGHYNRRDEMEYKMHRLSGGSQARKRKVSESKEAASKPKPVPFETPRAAPTFNRSFKIKKDKPPPGKDSTEQPVHSSPSPIKGVGKDAAIELEAKKGMDLVGKEQKDKVSHSGGNSGPQSGATVGKSSTAEKNNTAAAEKNNSVEKSKPAAAEKSNTTAAEKNVGEKIQKKESRDSEDVSKRKDGEGAAAHDLAEGALGRHSGDFYCPPSFFPLYRLLRSQSSWLFCAV